jgi:hypothetical protein
MKWTLLTLAMALLIASLGVGQQGTVTRLDDSAISATEIDGTMARLMKAAEVIWRLDFISLEKSCYAFFHHYDAVSGPCGVCFLFE